MKSLNRKQWYFVIGLILLTVIAFSCFILAIRLFTRQNAVLSSMYNAGIDVMGSFVCAMLFFGCIGDLKSELEE